MPSETTSAPGNQGRDPSSEVAQQLEQAARSIYLTGAGDLAEQLCARNFQFGLAKIRWVERELGIDTHACFVGAPDATVTRNQARWRQGFGYGGLLAHDPSIAVLDAKPNACGMLVGELPKRLAADPVQARAVSAQKEQHLLDGVSLGYDLDDSNHFIDVCELDESFANDATAPEHLFVIHSSGKEHRRQSPFGPGLYIDESPTLQDMAEPFETPWGSLSILQGDAAQDYVRFCQRVQRFNRDRRALWARQILGEFETLVDQTHQGFAEAGRFYLGANWFEGETLLPLTLGPNQPVYLIRPKPNFSDAAIQAQGWGDRADPLGQREILRGANILPHGGGYAFSDQLQLRDVACNGDHRVFSLDGPEGQSMQFDQIRDLPFSYRDDIVLKRLEQLDLGMPVARYKIRFIVR